MALVIPKDESAGPIAFVPRLEVDTASAAALIDETWHYFEYPGDEPPLTVLADNLNKRSWNRKLLADGDGYPGIWGYQGPRLSELMASTEIELTSVVQDMWSIKSPAEIEIIKETAIWGNLAHQKLQDYTHAGGQRKLRLS